jgi:hypothetical protein
VHLLAFGNTAVSPVQTGLLYGIEQSDVDAAAKESLRTAVGALGVVLLYVVGQTAGHHTVRNVATYQTEAGFSLAEPLINAAGQKVGDIITHKTPVQRNIGGEIWLELGQLDLSQLHETENGLKPRNAVVDMKPLAVLVSPDGTRARAQSAEVLGDAVPNLPTHLPPNMRHPNVYSRGMVTLGVGDCVRTVFSESFMTLNAPAAAEPLRQAQDIVTRAASDLREGGDSGSAASSGDHVAELGQLRRQTSSYNDTAAGSIQRVASALSALSAQTISTGDTATAAAGRVDDPVPDLEALDRMSEELMATAQTVE